MTVFKFGTASGIKGILDSESIWVTSPLDLNDPFEMRPSWTNSHDERHRQGKMHLHEVTRGKPLMGVFEDGVKPIGLVPDIAPGPSVDVENQYGLADLYNSRVFRELQGRFRVLSLVSDLFDVTASHTDSEPEATLMWTHYAQSFQGACVAIDESLAFH